jgi:hypothetical protein
MKILLSTLVVVLSSSLIAQNPFLNIITEEVSIPASESANIEADIGGTPSTYRIFVNIPDNYELQILYGDAVTPLTLSSTGTFYQDPLGGASTINIDPGLYGANPELAYDSWLTIGYEDFNLNLLQVFPFPTVFDAWEGGAMLNLADVFGSGLFLPTSGLMPINQPDENGMILVGQVTSDGQMDACFNFQIRRLNPDGTIYDPPGEDTSEVEVFNNVCIQINEVNDCPADFDNSGSIFTGDLLIFLSNFGCTGNCIADLNDDSLTNATDLLMFLSVFGDDCE